MIDRTRESRTPPARRIPSTTTYNVRCTYIGTVRARLCAVCLGQTRLRWCYTDTRRLYNITYTVYEREK